MVNSFVTASHPKSPQTAAANGASCWIEAAEGLNDGGITERMTGTRILPCALEQTAQLTTNGGGQRGCSQQPPAFPAPRTGSQTDASA